MTRRSFAKIIVGTAAYCSCFQLYSFAMTDSGNISKKDKNDQNPGDEEKLVAVCGMYCGACPSYIVTHTDDEEKKKTVLKPILSGPWKLKITDLVCDGCLGADRILPSCRNCDKKLCSYNKQRVARCSDCPDFPCPRIIDGDKS